MEIDKEKKYQQESISKNNYNLIILSFFIIGKRIKLIKINKCR